jgi:hypothetical protein
VVLSGFLYWQTRSYLAQRVDEALNREQAAFEGRIRRNCAAC